LLQAGINTTMITRHHRHHFPTSSLEHYPLNCLPSSTLLTYLKSAVYSSRMTALGMYIEWAFTVETSPIGNYLSLVNFFPTWN
jgi:hypothetical protein